VKKEPRQRHARNGPVLRSYVGPQISRWHAYSRQPGWASIPALFGPSAADPGESGGRVQLTGTPGFGLVRTPQFSHGRTEHGMERSGGRNDGMPGPRWPCCLHKGVRHRGTPPAGQAPGALVGVWSTGRDR
jgi:hypothetical protein